MLLKVARFRLNWPPFLCEQHSASVRRYVSIKEFANGYITVVDLAARSGRMLGVKAIVQTDRGVQPAALDARCNTVFRRKELKKQVATVWRKLPTWLGQILWKQGHTVDNLREEKLLYRAE